MRETKVAWQESSGEAEGLDGAGSLPRAHHLLRTQMTWWEEEDWAAAWCFAEQLPQDNDPRTSFKFPNKEKAANVTTIENAVKVNK